MRDISRASEADAPVNLITRADSLRIMFDPSAAPLFWNAERVTAAGAWCSHVPFAHWLMAETAPALFVELGTHTGVSYSAFCGAVVRANLATRCYAVDTWQGDSQTGTYTGEEVYDDFRRFHDARFGAFSTMLRCSFDEALGSFTDGSIDLLHIDGYHTLDAVNHDFQTWLPKLSERGVVLFHDTNERRRDFGVWHLWTELSRRYPSFEFLHGHGLGVLAIGGRVPEAINDLCALTKPDDVASVRARFAALGERWSAEFRLRETEDSLAQHASAAARAEQLRVELERAHQAEKARLEQTFLQALADAQAQSAQVRDKAQKQIELAGAQHKKKLDEVRAESERAIAEVRREYQSRTHSAVERAQQADARAAAIENSTVWRTSRPVRMALRRFPGLRRTARRVLQAGWWTVTLQLPAQLRKSRERRAQIRAVSASPLFDRTWYLSRNPDVTASGIDPVVHYVMHGASEGRSPGPAFALDSPAAILPGLARAAQLVPTSPTRESVVAASKAVEASSLFDRNWYLQQYQDVADAGFDPALHYVLHGAADRRSPGPHFNSAWYLDRYPDVAASGMNPLLHYVRSGASEGRETRSVDIYAQWVQEYDTLNDDDRQAIRAHIGELPFHPLISIVVPVYNTAEGHLREMIESIEKQLYQNWELCVADDASTKPHVGETLREYAARDPRIKVTTRSTNGHVCAATNSALDLATGEFVALVDHDDVISERALYEIVAELAAHPDADVLYSDSDNIDDDGHRSSPYFKTDWDPDLMLGHNMVSHLGVYRRSLVDSIGRLRPGFEGSQDYDLMLRASEATTAGRIRHVPAVLYHWRRDAQSPSFSEASLERCVVAARRAIRDHLERTGRSARVAPAPKTISFTRVIDALPPKRPLVSMIVPTRDRADLLGRCADGVLTRTDYDPLELIIVDNESTEPETAELLARLSSDPRVRIIPFPGPFNFAAMNNRAVQDARGEIVVLLNNDVDVISPMWLEELVSHALRPEVGAVGARLLYPDGRVQHAGVVLGVGHGAGHFFHGADGAGPGYYGFLALTRRVSAVTAACMALRRSTYLEVAGMDEDCLPVAFNDVDLCLRISERGYGIVWTPHAELSHVECASRGNDLDPERLARLERDSQHLRGRWGSRLDSDPFYNPNCATDAAYFDAAFPPRRNQPWARFRQPHKPTSAPTDRTQMLLAGIGRSARILEIGPSYNPIAAKADGWNTATIDHATRAELVEKYTGHGVDVNRIEDVDFVWRGGALADAVPDHLRGSFDVLIASHVIEHTTDFVGFLESAEALLDASGTVVLAVPDTRYCFDYFRPLTTTGDILDAHAARRSRHTRRNLFNHTAYVVQNDGAIAWGQGPIERLELLHSLEEARNAFDAATDDPSSPYRDAHAWQFVPSSFALLLLETAALRATDWLVNRITPATGCEFYVWLKRGGIAAAAALSPSELAARRLALLENVLLETGEQSRLLANSHAQRSTR